MLKQTFMTILSGIMLAVGIAAAAQNEPPATTTTKQSGLRASVFGSFYPLGETVIFSIPATLPEKLQELTGTIFNADGKQIAKKTVSGTELDSNGWSWNPSETGLYEIRFSGTTVSGAMVDFQEKYSLTIDGDTANYVRERYTVGIVPQPLSMSQRSPLFGFSNQLDEPELYRSANLLGLSFSRLHAIGWGSQFTNTDQALEPEPGKFNWTNLDKHMEQLKKYNFTVIGNILYTPRWASPHPEKNNISICVREFSAYAPAKMSYFENFLKALVQRYGKDIRIWEIWNEPSVKGGSCFWLDTPENYVKLLKTASETLRREQPGTELWLAGLGTNPFYYRFYKIIHEQGAAQYYDKMALHGKTSDPREYIRMDQAAGRKTKPWLSSESHDVLRREGTVTSSEQEIAADLVKGILSKIKLGHERIALFEFRNLAEIESLPFFGKHARITHASGLFRRRPQVEPRLAAVVLANLARRIRSNAKIAGEYKLDKGAFEAALVSSKGTAPLLIFWSNRPEKIAVLPNLKQLIASNPVFDWEGKKLDQLSFDPGKIYFLANPDPTALKRLPQTEFLALESSTVASGSITGLGTRNGIFLPDSWDKRPAQDLTRINTNWHAVPGINKKLPDNFNASFFIGATQSGIELQVEVNDSQVKTAPAGEKQLWNYDSLQFAVDVRGKGSVMDIMEFAIGMAGDRPVMMKTMTPDNTGDLPTGYTPAWQPIKHGDVKIEHSGMKSVYKVKLDWSELYPCNWIPEKPLAFSLLVNDNDGNGRLGYLEWGSGIGGNKSAGSYGRIFFVNQECNILAKDRLNLNSGWVVWVTPEEKASGSSMTIAHNQCDLEIGPATTDKNNNINNIQLIKYVSLAENRQYLYCFKATATMAGAASVEYILSKAPWTKFCSTMCDFKVGSREYFVTLSPKNGATVSADTPVSLRFFLGDLPTGKMTFSDFRLYELTAP